MSDLPEIKHDPALVAILGRAATSELGWDWQTHPTPAACIAPTIEAVLDRLVELGQLGPPVEVVARRDERGIVALDWPAGPGAVLMAPDLLLEVTERMNTCRRNHWRAQK